MGSYVAVGQLPGDVGNAFATLPALMVGEVEQRLTLLPGLCLYLLWIRLVADGEVGLAMYFGYLAGRLLVGCIWRW